MAAKIQTLNPDPNKAGVNISQEKYDAVKTALLDAIRSEGIIAFKHLADAVSTRLPADFDGSVGWYTTTVKLDLEARGVIVRVPGQTPQHIRLAADA